VSKGKESAERSKLRQLYTPSHKLGNSLKVRDERTISVEKGSNETVSRAAKETVHETIDPINKKYKETYGVNLVSRSKEKDRSQSRRKSLKKYELSDIYEKADMNKTLMPYNRTNKAKSNRIGVDKGFDNTINTLNTIDNIYRKPQGNRRFAYH
jgi:hypothetical protein